MEQNPSHNPNTSPLPQPEAEDSSLATSAEQSSSPEVKDVDWENVWVVGRTKDGTFTSVDDIRGLRTDKIDPLRGKEARQAAAEEIVDGIFPVDKKPEDLRQDVYDRWRMQLSRALRMPPDVFKEKIEDHFLGIHERRKGESSRQNESRSEVTDDRESVSVSAADTLKIDPSIHIAVPDGMQTPGVNPESVAQPGGRSLEHLRIPDDIFIARPGETQVDADIAANQAIIARTEQGEAALEQKTELEVAQAAKHMAYVEKLRGPVFLYPSKRKELKTAYEEAQREYMAVLDEATKKDVEVWAQEGKTGEEIQQLIAQSTNQRFQDDVEKQRQLLVAKSGRIGKLLEMYANIDKPWKKVAVTAGLGLAGLGLGLTVGFAAGAAGTIVGAATAAATAAGGMKAFGAARIYKLRQADLFKKQADLPQFDVAKLGDGVNTPTTEGVRRLAVDFLRNQSNEQLERGEKIKKQAVYWSLGSVAVGGAAGTLIHGVWSGEGMGAHWQGGQIQHSLDSSDQSSSSPSGPDLDNSGPRGGGEVELPSTSEPDPSRGEIIQDYIAERGAAQKIRPGEGLFQTLKELGVPAEHRREFMEKYGEKLIKKFPQAFYRMPNGETGILMTENGKMPRKALEYMVSKADKSNWIELPEPSVATAEQVSFHESISPETTAEQLSASGAPTEVAAERLIANSEVVPANSVGSRGEYLMTTLEELRRAGVIDVSQDQHYGLMRQVGPRLWNLRYDDGTPVASIGRFGRWYLNSSPDGRLHPQAIREIERYVRQSSYGLAA